jgi:hypothetical protein
MRRPTGISQRPRDDASYKSRPSRTHLLGALLKVGVPALLGVEAGRRLRAERLAALGALDAPRLPDIGDVGLRAEFLRELLGGGDGLVVVREDVVHRRLEARVLGRAERP